MRRTLAIAATVGLGVVALAQTERATFIMTSGERVSGTVVFHTEARTNIRADKNEFNVGMNDGSEVAIPFHQVALIDFAGGTPRQTELAAIPGEGHLLALRNGQTRRGRLVDLIGGNTIRWRAPDGETQDVPIREASRIYLNADASRAIYDFQGQPGASTSAWPAPPPPPGSGGVLVQANQPWTDTGITVRKGQNVRFVAVGQIRFRDGEGQLSNPNGNPEVHNPRFPVPALPVGGLIAKVANSAAFPIGMSGTPITMPENGRLMLGINDDNFVDNQGAYRVTINPGRR